MAVIEWLLPIFLIVCAIGISISANLLNSVMIFMRYSLVMSVVWVMLKYPDLAVMGIAVGTGVTCVMFFLALRKIRDMEHSKKVEKL